MSDIVERLRAYPAVPEGDALEVGTVCRLMEESAARITELEAEVATAYARHAATITRMSTEIEGMRGLCIRWIDFLDGPDEMGNYVREKRMLDEFRAIKAAALERP